VLNLRACLPTTLLLACTGASPPLGVARPVHETAPGSGEGAPAKKARYVLPRLSRADSRPWIDPEPFRVLDLPRVTLPRPLRPADAAGVELAVGQSAPELVISRRDQFVQANAARVDLSIRDAPFSEILVDGARKPIECDRGALAMAASIPLVPIRWATVRSPPSTGVEYAVTDAWFDVQRCDAAVVRRTSVRPKRLYGGFFYAFRERAPQREHEVLTLLFPRAELVAANGTGADTVVEAGAFTRVSMPLVRGGGASVMLRLDTSTLEDWIHAGRSSDEGGQARIIPSIWGRSSILAGVEVSQGVSDPEAIGLAYMEMAPF
jgi:hypothetical protein